MAGPRKIPWKALTKQRGTGTPSLERGMIAMLRAACWFLCPLAGPIASGLLDDTWISIE